MAMPMMAIPATSAYRPSSASPRVELAFWLDLADEPFFGVGFFRLVEAGRFLVRAAATVATTLTGATPPTVAIPTDPRLAPQRAPVTADCGARRGSLDRTKSGPQDQASMITGTIMGRRFVSLLTKRPAPRRTARWRAST